MRGIVGRICHGPERRPLEPHSVIVPRLRAMSWSLSFVGSFAAFAAVITTFVRPDVPLVALGVVTVTAWTLALLVRFATPIVRPELDVVAYDPDVTP